MPDRDLKHAQEIARWFRDAGTEKYAKGIIEHGGHLPDKGGLLRELENEMLDGTIYTRTLRDQLTRVYAALLDGRNHEAMTALDAIIHGSPADRLPV